MFLVLPGKQATFFLILSLSTGKETVMAEMATLDNYSSKLYGSAAI